MMHKKFFLLSIALLSIGSILAVKGPMDADWFYDPNNPFKTANEHYQNLRWDEAITAYEKGLKDKIGNEYDQNLARLNLATCLLSQHCPSEHWASFDKLIDIDPAQQISVSVLQDAQSNEPKTVHVRTDLVGTGDIAHFFKAAKELRKKTGWRVIVSIQNRLKDPFTSAAERYKLTLVDNKEVTKTDYTTHLIALLGYFKINPSSLTPKKPLFTASDWARNAVLPVVNAIMATHKKIAVVFLGEDRMATLMGGKQLPRDNTKHGRHCTSEPFEQLLKNNDGLTIIDCSSEKNRVKPASTQEKQYHTIPQEDKAFDTIIALANIMNEQKEIVGFGADNGPTNIFARALSREAQKRMALIIPNGDRQGEYDARMERIRSTIKNCWSYDEYLRDYGQTYNQSLSNCRVYKCDSPEKQTLAIAEAYNDMTRS